MGEGGGAVSSNCNPFTRLRCRGGLEPGQTLPAAPAGIEARVGHVAVGMHRQRDDLQLTHYDERGWRVAFYTTGMDHSPTSATGTALGADALAHDAAGGVGGVETG